MHPTPRTKISSQTKVSFFQDQSNQNTMYVEVCNFLFPYFSSKDWLHSNQTSKELDFWTYEVFRALVGMEGG